MTRQTTIETADHAADDCNVERGEQFLAEVPRHMRGPAIPALRKIGLSPKEACEAVRRHNLKLARAG